MTTTIVIPSYIHNQPTHPRDATLCQKLIEKTTLNIPDNHKAHLVPTPQPLITRTLTTISPTITSNRRQNVTAIRRITSGILGYEGIKNTLRLSHARVLISRILLVHRQPLIIAAVNLDEDGSAKNASTVRGACRLRGADVAVSGIGIGGAFAIVPYGFGEGSTGGKKVYILAIWL